MKAGRKCDPQALKIRRGTARRDRTKPQAETPGGKVQPPSGLPSEARSIWKQMAPIAQEMGSLKPADALAFGQWCVMTADLKKTWSQREVAPAALITQWRLLGEMFGLAGEKSRVGFASKPDLKENVFMQFRKFP